MSRLTQEFIIILALCVNRKPHLLSSYCDDGQMKAQPDVGAQSDVRCRTMRAAGTSGPVSRAMIGMSGKDCGGSVKLFCEHDSGEPVRQRHRPEREFEGRSVENLRAVAVRST